ncbi:hypothetical protein TWF281_009113 [Arthrobotrys megalospora]
MATNAWVSEIDTEVSAAEAGVSMDEHPSDAAATKKAPLIDPKVWEAHKPEIEAAYVRGRCRFEDLQKDMEKKGFNASRAQYMKKIREWGFQKNNRENKGSQNQQVGGTSFSICITINSNVRLALTKIEFVTFGASEVMAKPRTLKRPIAGPLPSGPPQRHQRQSFNPVVSEPPNSTFWGTFYGPEGPTYPNPTVASPYGAQRASSSSLRGPDIGSMSAPPLAFGTNHFGPQNDMLLPEETYQPENPFDINDDFILEDSDQYPGLMPTSEPVNNVGSNTDLENLDISGEPVPATGAAGANTQNQSTRSPSSSRNQGYRAGGSRRATSAGRARVAIRNWQPIHNAVQAGSLSLVKLFLEKSPECADLRTDKGVTPLWMASQGGYTKIAKLLIKSAKVDVNVTTPESERTPLHQAAQRGNEEIVKLLLTHGAHADPRDVHGVTPLWAASQQGAVSIVKFLAARKDVNINATTTDAKRTAIHQAAQNGHIEVVKILLEHRKILPDPRDRNGITPLYAAANGGYTEIVKMLLNGKANAEVIATNGSNRRPFHQAANNGHTAICKLFLDYQVDFEPLDDTNCSPLFFACQGGHHEIVKLLLAAGADYENAWCGQKGGGRRCLHQAAQNGHLEVVQLLLDAGAAIDPETDIPSESSSDDESNNSDQSSSNDSDAMGEVVVRRRRAVPRVGKKPPKKKRRKGNNKRRGRASDSKTPTPLSLAAHAGQYDIAKLLIERGADIHSICHKDLRPIHQAVFSGKAEIVKLLVDKKVDVDAKEIDGWSPVMIAAQIGNCNIIEILADAGANINSEATSGATALFMAAQQGHTAAVKVLLDHGARSFATLKSGRHPIHQAAQNAHFEVIKLLVEHDPSSINSKDNAGCTVMGLAASGREPVRDRIVRYLYEIEEKTGNTDS